MTIRIGSLGKLLFSLVVKIQGLLKSLPPVPPPNMRIIQFLAFSMLGLERYPKSSHPKVLPDLLEETPVCSNIPGHCFLYEPIALRPNVL